jgi:hypothetical protein
MNEQILAFCCKQEKLYSISSDIINDIEDALTSHEKIFRVKNFEVVHGDLFESIKNGIECAVLNSGLLKDASRTKSL